VPPAKPRPSLPRERLDELVRTRLNGAIGSLTELAGGASTRRYFRVVVRDGTSEERSVVAMFTPDGARPAEIETAATTRRRWPFLEVRDLLEARGVRVPVLYGEDCDAGLLLLEDLGDVTLADALRSAPDRRAALYRRAVADLAQMHGALTQLPADSVVAARVFDEPLLRWELQHFVDYALDARGVQRSAASKTELDGAFDAIARDLAARPRGFVHRDYQSRNLMLDSRAGADALVVIDFQDALLGPISYDLVALLRDSYQDLDEPFVAAMLDGYCDARGFATSARLTLRDEFDRVTVQRKLKDAGRFVFIQQNKGDESFLRFIAPSLRRVRIALTRLEHERSFAKVSALLADALPEEFQ
jgi:aminoglycoside/choline kinase family phosphotransferase